jgi:hypothetical protein
MFFSPRTAQHGRLEQLTFCVSLCELRLPALDLSFLFAFSLDPLSFDLVPHANRTVSEFANTGNTSINTNYYV